MANWLTRRFDFWKRAFYNKVRAAVGVFITIFTVLLIIRDGVADPEKRDWVLLRFIPNLPWYSWAILGLVALLFLVLEGAYAEHKLGMTGFQRRYRARLTEVKRDHLAELTSARVGSLISNNRPAEPSEAIPIRQESDQIKGQNNSEIEARQNQGVTAPPLEGRREGRIVLDVTPGYLLHFYNEHTRVQADKLIEAFVGKWIPATGTVANVSTFSEGTATVYLRYHYSINAEDFYSIIAADFTEKGRADHVVTLPKGSTVRVLGKVVRADNSELYLTECEMIS